MADIQMLQDNFVGPGERKTYEALRKGLPPSWVGVASKEIVVRSDYSCEADFIIVGENTIFVIEEKSWSGDIHGDDSWWYLRGTPRSSPLNQVEGVAKALAGQIRDSFSALRNETRLVVGVVILSSPDVSLTLNKYEHRRNKVLFLHDAAERLVELDSARRNPFVAVSRDSIAQRLGRLQTRQVPKEIGGYRIEETLPPTGIFKNWRATHQLTGEERLLRAVTVRHTRTDQERAAFLAPILREYSVYSQALLPLASEGLVPTSSDPIPYREDFHVFPIRPPKGISLVSINSARPSTENAVAFAKDAFGLLARIHGSGVIHRNISPQKLLVTPDKRAAIVDFLIARIDGSQTIAASAWRTDDISPFTAPELRNGVSEATPAADVYGLSASLIYWITGVQPDGTGDVLVPEQANDEIRGLLLMELAKGLVNIPAERPSAATLAAAL
jgi:hypothetical protein